MAALAAQLWLVDSNVNSRVATRKTRGFIDLTSNGFHTRGRLLA